MALFPAKRIVVSPFNLVYHDNYRKNRVIIDEYLRQYVKFIKLFVKQRYGLNMRVEMRRLKMTVDNYDHLRALDRASLLDLFFGKTLQMYLGFGLRLRPNGYADATGYAECEYVISDGQVQLKPGNMFYADMPTYSPSRVPKPTPAELELMSPYHVYSDFSRTGLHEIEHDVLGLQRYPGWIVDVHKAKEAPYERWSADGQVLPWSEKAPSTWPRDKLGNIIYFCVQQDPRRF